MATKNFVTEDRLKVDLMELSQKVFTKIMHSKHLSIENSILLKGIKRPNIKSSKITCLSKTFFVANLDGRL